MAALKRAATCAFPWWVPDAFRRPQHLDGLRERTGIRKFTRRFAKTFPNRIHPNVPRDRIHAGGAANDVVVIFLLPQHPASPRMIQLSSFLFEGLDKTNEVAALCLPFRQNVQMVRHQTIGMDGKCELLRFFLQVLQQPLRACGRSEQRGAILAADRDEVPAPAPIVGARQPDVLVPEVVSLAAEHAAHSIPISAFNNRPCSGGLQPGKVFRFFEIWPR